MFDGQMIEAPVQRQVQSAKADYFTRFTWGVSGKAATNSMTPLVAWEILCGGTGDQVARYHWRSIR